MCPPWRGREGRGRRAGGLKTQTSITFSGFYLQIVNILVKKVILILIDPSNHNDLSYNINYINKVITINE